VKVPYIDLEAQINTIKDEVMETVQNVICSGSYILGEQLQLFEKGISKTCNTKYAVGVSNGTDALVLAMKSLGIGVGDEVITVPNSFLASTSSIALTGANPIFVDVGNDLNIDPSKIESVITEKTKAILPVHLTGRPANMEPIMNIAQGHGLYVIEDCAQAICAVYDGDKVGSIGDIGCFSLHPLKNLNACGDGGVITTNNQGIYEWLLKARNHGLKDRDNCEFWAYNNRLDALQAAILNVKMKYLEKWIIRRREIAHLYHEGLKDLIKTPQSFITNKHQLRSVYHTYIVQVNNRDELLLHLQTNGVDPKVHYPIPIHLQKAANYLGYTEGDFPITEELSRKILSLPIYPELIDSQICFTIEKIREFYE